MEEVNIDEEQNMVFDDEEYSPYTPVDTNHVSEKTIEELLEGIKAHIIEEEE